MSGTSRVWVVDRVEGDVVVLVPDSEVGPPAAVVEVDATAFARRPREGDVLNVPAAGDGSPDWSRAAPDEDARRRIEAEGAARLERLRRRDPGGDVSL